jgi:hypothetical protein
MDRNRDTSRQRHRRTGAVTHTERERDMDRQGEGKDHRRMGRGTWTGTYRDTDRQGEGNKRTRTKTQKDTEMDRVTDPDTATLTDNLHKKFYKSEFFSTDAYLKF